MNTLLIRCVALLVGYILGGISIALLFWILSIVLTWNKSS